MTTIPVPLDGNIISVERKRIPLPLLVLDIENPRIQYHLDARLTDEVTQDQVKFALAATQGDQYEKLFEHIECNGGIYNPIWVKPDDGLFRVIEGNTRSLVYSELAEKYANDDRWKAIDAYVLPDGVDRHKVNFIRLEAHLFGTTPWDAYEKANELHRLYTEEDYSLKRLQQLTKLSLYDIKTNIQAFMDMRDQYFRDYYRPGEQLKFSYFAEFRKNKGLKELAKTGSLSIQGFCRLVGNGKLGRGEHVRKLAMVWKDDEARNALLEGDMEAALDQLAQKNPAAKSKLFEKIVDVTCSLKRMGFGEVIEMKKGLQPAKVAQLKDLHAILTERLRFMEVIP